MALTERMRWAWLICVLLALPGSASAGAPAPPGSYPALVSLFTEWRAFEHPALKNGVPDYSAGAMDAKVKALPSWRNRLQRIDPSAWPIAEQTDWKLVQAEMNGLDFNLRVLRPWARDPAFYVTVWPTRTDVPSREAPVAYPEIQLYNEHFPLSPAAQHHLATQLGTIPDLLAQASINLKDSNARDLWICGVQELRNQAQTLRSLQEGTLEVSTLEGHQHATLHGASPELQSAVTSSRAATEAFIAWLERLAPGKTGSSGVGKDDYTWYQQNVHFIPWTWDEEVALLRRELERAQASLRLEEQHNRNLPPLEPARDAAAFDAVSNARLDKFVRFLVDAQIIPDKPYLRAALKEQLGPFIPEDKRVFFTRITHREPMLLLSHDYHWIDLARMRDEPNSSPIRREALLSNIWDNRAEGFATAFEEILMQAGLYDDNPRARELVWIMLANRAARGLASLYVQANLITLEQAGQFQAEWTPRGWARANDQLTAFEQLLYLRQPGYGTSYITGKLLFDGLMTDYAQGQTLEGKNFVLRNFMDRFNREGMIPISLMIPEMVRDGVRDTP